MIVTDKIPTTSREDIAANVRAEMARRQLDQQPLAQALGKSQAAISDRVNGKIHFRIHELQTIAGLLEVPLERLLEPAATTDQVDA